MINIIKMMYIIPLSNRFDMNAYDAYKYLCEFRMQMLSIYDIYVSKNEIEEVVSRIELGPNG